MSSERDRTGSSHESTLDHRGRLRQQALAERRRRRWATLALLLVPVLVAGLYAMFVAAPRYSAESRFSVRSGVSQATGPAGTPSLLATGGGAGAAGGFVDGWAVSQFLRSRDCMRQLDRKVGLRRYLDSDGLDPFNRLAADADADRLYAAYLKAVDVSYNLIEQVDVLRVSAFSPDDARLLSEALIEIAQQFVGALDEQGVADALKVSRQAVALAERDAVDARNALTEWRIRNGNIDPVAESGMLLDLKGKIESELNTAKVNLDKIRALKNPDHPMLPPAQGQVSALQGQLDALRARMSGKNDTEATRLRAYEALLHAQTFADQNLMLARQNHQQAFTDTLRLARYLGVIARPVPAVRPDSPDVVVLLLEALAAGFVLVFAVRIGQAFYREFRHG